MNFQERQRRAVESEDFLKLCFAQAKGPITPSGYRDTAAIAAQLRSFGSKRLLSYMEKAAVNGAATTSAGWAGYASDSADAIAADWLITTSARSFIGRLGTRRVPFNCKVLSTAAPDATFPGQGMGTAPVALDLEASVRLDPTGIATIAVVSNESLQTWQPGTRENLDAVLSLSLVRGLDRHALDPTIAGATGDQPASLLYGLTPLALMGTTAATILPQIKQLLQALVQGGSDLTEAAFAVHPLDAITLSTLITTEGVRAFPQMTALGGFIEGVPAYTTVGASSGGSPSERVLALIDGNQIAMADNGGIEISASQLTVLQMDNTPTQDATDGTGSTNVSMFQTESTAIKLRRTVNWQRLQDAAVAYLTITA